LVIDLADWKVEELPVYEGTAFAVHGTSSVAGAGDAWIYQDLGAESPRPLAAIISIASNGAGYMRADHRETKAPSRSLAVPQPWRTNETKEADDMAQG
jgi:hypothetical protein